MTRIFYFIFLKPLSLLPLNFLYLISNFLFVINHYGIQYRKKVILNNLQNSFPNSDKTEHQRIAKSFNQFFCDFIVESIKCFSISEKQAMDRCKFNNPEILDHLYKKNKSIVLACGHYSNWEMAAACLNKSLKHQSAAIYKPLNNSFFDQKFRKSRSKFGVQLIPKQEAKTFLKENQKKNCIIGFGCDQSPKKSNGNLFWTKFLNQDTAIMFGTEKYAVDYDYAVVFMGINRVKRGYYEIDLEIIEENPRESEYGSISKKHTQLLEEQIKRDPAYWLWSHKRWKLKRDANEICH